MQQSMLSCIELGYRYDEEEEPIIHEIDLQVRAGERVAIVGASGSGKSTLCQLLCGLLPRSGGGHRSGQVLLAGFDPAVAPLSEVAAAVCVLLQDPDAQLVQGIVEDEAAFGPENMRVPQEEIEERVVQSLAAVKLSDRRSDPVRSLSGGQRQRTALAAVLAMRPRLYIFDDACASLDAAAQADFLQLCSALQAEGRTVITASGRFDDVARAAGRVIVMDGGRVVLDGPPEALLRRCGEQLAQLGLLPRPAGEAAAPKPPAAPALLEVRSLSYRYPGGREVLRDIDAALYPGQLTLLTGENGSGKTTLSRLIVGLLPAPAARIYFQGEDVQRLPVYRRAEQIGYVFQQPEYMFTSSNVWEELIYCLHGGISERQRAALTAEQQERAAMLLEVAGLSDRRSMSPYLLSYGEKRLLSIICQLILPRALYILDEPTSGMDYAGIDRVVHLCRIVMKEGAAVLMITHDPELMSPYANAFIHLRNGKSDCASYE